MPITRLTATGPGAIGPTYTAKPEATPEVAVGGSSDERYYVRRRARAGRLFLFLLLLGGLNGLH